MNNPTPPGVPVMNTVLIRVSGVEGDGDGLYLPLQQSVALATKRDQLLDAEAQVRNLSHLTLLSVYSGPERGFAIVLENM